MVINIFRYIPFSTQAFDPLPVTRLNAKPAFIIPSSREKNHDAERLTPDAQLQKASALFLNFLSSRTASTWSFDSALFPSHKLDVPHVFTKQQTFETDWLKRQTAVCQLSITRTSQLATRKIPSPKFKSSLNQSEYNMKFRHLVTSHRTLNDFDLNEVIDVYDVIT